MVFISTYHFIVNEFNETFCCCCYFKTNIFKMGALVSFLLFLNNFIQVSNECWSFSAPYYSPSPTPLLKFPSPINHFGFFAF